MILIGFILIAIGISVMIFDIFTNKVQGKRALIFISLPCALGALFMFGTTGVLFLTFMAIGLGIWIWLEELYNKLNKTEIDRFKTFTGRLGVCAISFFIFLVFYFILYPSVSAFFNHIGRLIITPRLAGVITTFIIIYCTMIFLFGAIYATLHLKFDNAGFQSCNTLLLRDFFLYSAFNMATQGYKDVVPEHWVLATLSIIQIFVGIILLGVYLAGAFTFIVQSPAP